MKYIIHISQYYFPIIFILTFIFNGNNIFGQIKKPDLIITKVEFKYVKQKTHYKPGQPISGSDNLPLPLIFVTIKNIGSADFNKPFYVAYTDVLQDIGKGRYSHLILVNSQRDTIKVNHSIKTAVGLFESRNSNQFKFLIQTDGKAHHGDRLPLVEEENYNNNTYESDFQTIIHNTTHNK